MIDPTVLRTIRNGVCAVGYLTVPLRDYAKYWELPGMFKVVGTGFLVRDTTIITCAHVIDDLQQEQREAQIPAAQLFVSFVVPRREGQLGITVRLIRRAGRVRNSRIDVGFIDFEIVYPAHFQEISTLEVEERAADLDVSEHVAAFGYPHGSTLSEKDGKLRFGPLLQQGWVSGISPYHGSATIDEILLDLRAHEGMSGAPIFRVSTGVVGILQSGVRRRHPGDTFGTTTVFGQPLDRSTLQQWMSEHDLDSDP